MTTKNLSKFQAEIRRKEKQLEEFQASILRDKQKEKELIRENENSFVMQAEGFSFSKMNFSKLLTKTEILSIAIN